jgi:hypothetical protein
MKSIDVIEISESMSGMWVEAACYVDQPQQEERLPAKRLSVNSQGNFRQCPNDQMTNGSIIETN